MKNRSNSVLRQWRPRSGSGIDWHAEVGEDAPEESLDDLQEESLDVVVGLGLLEDGRGVS